MRYEFVTRRERRRVTMTSATPTLWSLSGHRRPRIQERLPPRCKPWPARHLEFRVAASPSPTGAWSASGLGCEPASSSTAVSTIPPSISSAAMLRYSDGDYNDPGPRRRSANSWARPPPRALPGLPPVLFGRVFEPLGASGCAHEARIIVEKPFGTDLASRATSTASCSAYSTSKISSASITISEDGQFTASCFFRFAMRCRSRFGTAITSEASRLTMAEDFGVQGRGSFTTRRARCAT